MKDQATSIRSLNTRASASVKTRTRDISHLTDSISSLKLKEQVKQKQLLGELHLSQYVQKQKVRKQNEAYIGNLGRIKTEERESMQMQIDSQDQTEILPLLEQISELNFEEIVEGLSNQRERITIQQSLKNTMNNFPKVGTSLTSLKSQSGHFFSTQPTGRKDAMILKEWFQNFVETIQKKQNLELKDKLISLSEALYLCLLEIIRQVSIQCSERGQLLHTLFKGYVLVFHKHFMLNERERRKLKFQLYEKDILDTQEKEQLEIKWLLKYQELEKQIQEQRIKEKTINLERNTYQQTINKLQSKVDIHQTIQRNAANTIENMRREIEKLKYQINKKQYQNSPSENKTEEIEEQDLSLSQVLKEINQKSKEQQNLDVIVKDVIEILPVVCHSVGIQTFSKCLCVVETQTDLQLISPQYDKLLTQLEIENTLKEYELKQQLEQQSWLDGLCDQINMHPDEPSIGDTDTRMVTKIDLIYEVSENDEGSPDIIKKKLQEGSISDRSKLDRSETQEKLIKELEKFGSDRLLQVRPITVGSGGQNNTQHNSQQSSQKLIKLSPQAANSSNQNQVTQQNSARGEPEKSNHKQQLVVTQTSLNIQKETPKNQQQKYFQSDKQDNKINLQPSNKQQNDQKKKKPQPTQQPPAHITINQQQIEPQLIQTEKQDAIPNLSKQQTTMLMLLYQIQKQKAQNAQVKVNETNELLTQVLLFARKLTLHILRTQFKTHTQIAEEFLFEFETLRKKIANDQEILEEEYVFDEEKEKEQKKKEAQKRRNGKIQKALRMNFATKQLKCPITIDKLTHPGVLLAIKAKEQSHLFKKVVAYWPVKNVLRTISQIYLEKTSFGGEQDFQIFVFNFFLNKYGFKHVAEKKYLQFLLSVIHFSQIFRVNMFARIICLLHDEHINYTQEESAFLLSGLEFIHNQTTLGVNIVQGDGEQKFHVPYLRALEYIKVHLENKLTEDEIKEVRNDLENLKESDSKNKSGVVDIDLFMAKVLDKYKNVTHRTKLFVIHAFQAADLDGNKKINHNEFLTLYRHIESDKFDFQEALDLFDEQADIIHQGEKNLSFNRFTSVCVNHQIFTENSLNEFIGKDQNVEDIFENIVKKWNEYKTEIQGLLAQLQPFVTQDIYQEWVNILFTLEKRILHQKNDVQNMRPILIAHKILKLELARLLDEDDQNQNKE